MKKEITTTLTGESGSAYVFSISPWESLFQSIGAVYTVLSKNRDKGTYQVLYIGESGNLSQLLTDHKSQNCIEYHRRTHIGVLIEPDEETRLLIEVDLLASYKPVCNY